MAEHTKGPRYTWRRRAANMHCIIIDGQKDGAIICETTNAKSADLICTNMNALEGYNPDAVRDVVEALRFYADENNPRPNEGPWGINSDDYGERARNALARLGGAS